MRSTSSNRPRWRIFRCVLLTGAFEPVDQARATAAGCDGVLAKPFEPQLVIGRVKELLARRPSAPVVPDTPAPAQPIPAEDRSNQSVADQLLAEPLAPAAANPGLDDYFDRLDAAFAGLASAPVGQAGQGAPTTAKPPASPIPSDIDWFAPTKEASAPQAEHWDMPVPALDTADLTLLSPSAPSPFDAGVPLDAFEALARFARPASEEPESIQPPPVAIEALVDVPQFAVVESSIQHVPTEPVTPAEPDALTPAALAEVMSPPSSLPAAERAPSAATQAVRLREPLELPSIADAFAALLAAEQSEPLPATAPMWPAAVPSDDALVEKVTRRVLARLSDSVIRDTVADLVSQVAERLVREEIERIKASIQ